MKWRLNADRFTGPGEYSLDTDGKTDCTVKVAQDRTFEASYELMTRFPLSAYAVRVGSKKDSLSY